jgi:hypothetical protein
MSTTGTKLTIDIRQLDLPLEVGKSYRFDVEEGLTREVGNNRSPSQPRINFETIDTITQAVIVSTNPVAGALSFTDPVNTSITFDRVVYKNSGNLYLYQVGGTLLRTIPVADADIILSTSTATVGLNLLGDINRSTDYYINFDGSSFNDNWFINATTVTNTSTFYFKTGVGPIVSSVSPVVNTTNSYVTSATLTYNGAISINPISKNFYVYRKDGGSDTLIGTVANNNARVNTVGTNSVRINLTGIVDSERTYYVTAELAVIKGSNQFDSEAIADDTVFKYSTGVGSTVTNTIPSNLTTNTNTSSYSLVFNKGRTVKNTGNFYLYKKGTVDELVSTIPVANITLTTGTSVSTATINLKTIVHGSSTYYITADYGVIKDEIEFSNKEIVGENTFKFTTRAGPTATSAVTTNTSVTPYFVFNETIYKNTGTNTLSVYDASSSTITLVSTIPMTSSSVYTTSSNRLVVDLFGKIDGGKTYYVTGESGIARSNFNGFNNETIASTATMRFTTAAKPTIWSIQPHNAPTPQSFAGYPPSFDSRIILTRNPFVKNTGSIYFYKSTNTSLALTIPITATTFTGTDVLMSTSYDLQSETKYYVTTDNDILSDTLGFKWTGIASSSTWQFFTGLDYVNTSSISGSGSASSIDYQFGKQVKLNDTYLAVLEKRDNYTTNGQVHIYNPTTNTLIRTITSSTAAGGFGQSIAINSTKVAVSDFKDSTTGRVLVYNTSTGNVVNVFTNTTATNGDLFGFSLAMNENYLIAGAPNNDVGATNAGAAYIYSLSSGTLLFAIPNPVPHANDQFGYSVAINDTYAIIGAPGNMNISSSSDNYGLAYVYSVATGNLVYTIQNRGINGFRTTKDRFGSAVALNNNYFFVSSPFEMGYEDNPYGAGAVYAFSTSTGASVYDILMPRETYPEMYNANQDGIANIYDSYLDAGFGSSIDVTDDYMVIGLNTIPSNAFKANIGDGLYRSYVYRISDALQVSSLYIGERFQDNLLYNSFGNSVAINKNVIAVSQPFQPLSTVRPGVVYMFNLLR